MNTIHLRIITPQKIVSEADVISVTVPSAEGEITVLPHHIRLLSQLKEGILKIRDSKGENLLAIGGGYLETDGKTIDILVSRAYGQNEIDESITKKAIDHAEKILAGSKDTAQIHEATAILRRSLVDMKLIKKRKHSRPS